MITLVNDKLLRAGKSPLGFVNPLMYQMSAANPAAFWDITAGDNKCSTASCCKFGYDAIPGWDPVTGLGDVKFPQFSDYAMAAAGGSTPPSPGPLPPPPVPPPPPPPPSTVLSQEIVFAFTAAQFDTNTKVLETRPFFLGRLPSLPPFVYMSG